MAYRNVFIESPAKLSVKNNQLVINTYSQHTIPLEDISCVLIESQQVNITAATLSKFSQEGICVFICDEKHMPCGILTGFNSHSRKPKILQAQLNTKIVLQKNLWKDIVVRKIENQSQVLKILDKSEWSEIRDIAKKVKTNDENNMEAVAASKYFRYLFGTDFSRSDESIINARLNYGYAIVRGIICRSLAAYGFEASIGIKHRSQLNAFNLADDLIEPFRAIVDLAVAQMRIEEESTLTSLDKKILFNLINCDIVFNKQNLPLSYAVEKTVQTLQSSMLEGKNKLCLCSILPLRNHEYE